MNSSAGALRSLASSTIDSTRETALSLEGRTTVNRTVLSLAIMPASTSSPLSMMRGKLSPVNAAVSKAAADPVSLPSTGTRSPAFTSMRSPTVTSSGVTVKRWPSRMMTAWSGRKAMSDLMLPLARFTARSCRASPIQYNAITATASGYSPMAKAPRLATVINRNSLKKSPSRASSMASRNTPSPVGNQAKAYQASFTHPFLNQLMSIVPMMMPATSIVSDKAGFHQFISSSSWWSCPCSQQQLQPWLWQCSSCSL